MRFSLTRARGRRGILCFIFLLLALTPLQAEPHIAVYFSPHGGCTEAIVQAIARSRKSILVEAYSFTSVPIAKALIAAKHRGNQVIVLLDKGELADRYSAARFLSRNGIPVYSDPAFRIAHSKVMILDHSTVITGSFNFTKSAEESNAENLLVISNAPDLAQKYTAIWNQHLALSLPYSDHHASRHPHKTLFNPLKTLGNFFHSLGI